MPDPQSLEEAFTDLLSTYGRTAHGDGPDAARKLALAVLDEAENSGCIYPYCDHPCEDCGLDKLRTRIEHLGDVE